MKKMLALLISILALVSCDLTFYEKTYITADDAFTRENEKIVLSQAEVDRFDGVLRFPVISDAHCGRELFDDGVERNYESLELYLEKMKANDDVTPLFMLGDILDKEDVNSISETEDFIRMLHSRNPEMEIIYTCGNHELQDCMVEDWEERYGKLSKDLDGKLKLTGSYVVGDPENPALMIYNVNSAYRIFGRKQLSALEDALRENQERNGGLKLILSHIPLSSSKVNQTLFNFIIGDERERNAMLRLMHEYGPTFMLCGHHHKGDTFNPYSDRSAEFIFSAFHKKGELFESQGRWYIFQIDVDSGDGRIWGFSIWDDIDPYGKSDEELDVISSEHYAFSIGR